MNNTLKNKDILNVIAGVPHFFGKERDASSGENDGGRQLENETPCRFWQLFKKN
jgi:hypothetical protein